MRKLLAIFLLGCSLTVGAQGESHEQYRQRMQKRFNAYKETQRKKYAEYRRKRNEEYAKFVREKWGDFEVEPLIPVPKSEEVPPVVHKAEDNAIPTATQLKLEAVVQAPSPSPQPQPIVPIEPLDVEDLKALELEDPEPEEPVEAIEPEMPAKRIKLLQPVADVPVKKKDAVGFTFFGTYEEVRVNTKRLLRLRKVNPNSVADAWLKLSGKAYTNLVYDCLQIRERRRLCDWAYLMMLKEMSAAVFGENTQEAELLTAYVYCQSGYKMRLCILNDKLRMIFASDHLIYDFSHFVIDGERFYSLLDDISGTVSICTQGFPQEKSLSLLITQEQDFDTGFRELRVHQSEEYPDMKAETRMGSRLMDFYSSYPVAILNGDETTRWVMHANTPLQGYIKKDIYPTLRKGMEGLSTGDAVNKILNFVQTGFEYGYDSEVWGEDRAFFAEESIYYPYCDCEDRSILFSRLVRDLLELDVVLVLYPGHLATAVHIPNMETGDYLLLEGKRYTICDPTYINAPAGMTMPFMDNGTAKAIVLE